MNQKIISLVRSGKLLDLLIGDPGFAILDHTNNEQDYLLIVRELLLMATGEGGSSWVTREFESSLKDLSKADGAKALRVLLAYLLVSKDMKYALSLDPRKLFEGVIEGLSKERTVELSSMVLAIKKLMHKLPDSPGEQTPSLI